MFTIKRIDKIQYGLLLGNLFPILDKALAGTEFLMVPFYKDKKDFGDVDIVVEANLDVVRDAVIKALDLKDGQHQSNSNIFSFVFENFQIDLICTVDNYKSSLAYFAYNDVGNILGRIFHKMGLKFGHKGLMYPIRINMWGELGASILSGEECITQDTKTIFEFIGVDFRKWATGFENLEDLFGWVSESKYFDPDLFEEKNLSGISRKRDRKRTTFSEFMDWVEKTKPDTNYKFPTGDLSRDKTRWIPLIEEHFKYPLTDKIKDAHDAHNKRIKRIEKFNGKIVMDITGLKDKDLGEFIESFKLYVIRPGKSFDFFIDENSAEDIKGVIHAYSLQTK